VVDEDEGIRTGIAELLGGYSLDVACFDDWDAVIAHKRASADPCIMLLDVWLGRTNSLTLYEEMMHSGLGCPVIFMTAYPDVPTTISALRLSAADFLIKPFTSRDLLAALQRAIGRSVSGNEDPIRLADTIARYRLLSPREMEVFTAMAEGLSNKEVARGFGISPRTVEIHRAKVMQKMQADSLASLIRMAIELGIVSRA